MVDGMTPETLERFKQRLLDDERDLAGRIARAVANARGGSEDPGDTADDSVNDERRHEQLKEADASSAQLTQVRLALARVDNGTFGACLVDGAPIEPSRLEAVPWAAHCLAHAEALEAPLDIETPTL